VLPGKLFRFNDLWRVGIKNHPTLKRWQDTQGFPRGRLLGENIRVWTEEEVIAWWDSGADPPPEIVSPPPLLTQREAGQEMLQRAAKAIPEISESGLSRKPFRMGGLRDE
jgi:predicted DNA-binding transcriptional regulator AlpA